jgi:hypothetical protein
MINLHSQGSTAGYAGATVLYFLSTDPLAKLSGGLWPRGGRFVRCCNMQARAAFKCLHNPHPQHRMKSS